MKQARKCEKKGSDSHTYPAKVDANQSWSEESLREYAKVKAASQGYLDYIIKHHVEQRKLLDALSGCGNYLTVANFFNVGVRRLTGGFTCKKHLHCQMCAMRRAARYAVAFREYLKHILRQEENAHIVPVLITFTIKNRADLAQAFAHIEKSLQSIYRQRRNYFTKGRRRDSTPTIFRHILGGAGSYEIKIGSGSKQWHVHYHMLALMDAREFVFTEQIVPAKSRDGADMYRSIYKPLEFEECLRSEWFQITGDSHQIDVRALYPRDRYANFQGAEVPSDVQSFLYAEDSSEEAVFSGLCEAFKYALSSADITHEQRFEAAETLKGRKLITRFGMLRNLQLPETDVQAVEFDLRNEQYYEEVYKYWHDHEEYKLWKVNSSERAINPVNFRKSMNRGPKRKNTPGRITEEDIKDFLHSRATVHPPF